MDFYMILKEHYSIFFSALNSYKMTILSHCLLIDDCCAVIQLCSGVFNDSHHTKASKFQT